VCDEIIEEEVDQDRDRRGNCVSAGEGYTLEELGGEYRKVNEDTNKADQSEYYKLHGEYAADQFVKNQSEILETYGGVEFAFAAEATLKLVGHLGKPDKPWARSDEVEQDLKSDRGDAGHGYVNESPVGYEEAAHRVLQFAGDYAAANEAAEIAEPDTRCREPAHAATFHVAAADD